MMKHLKHWYTLTTILRQLTKGWVNSRKQMNVCIIHEFCYSKYYFRSPDVFMHTDGDDLRQQLVEETHGQIHAHDCHNLVLWIVERCWPERHQIKNISICAQRRKEMKKIAHFGTNTFVHVLTFPQIWCG